MKPIQKSWESYRLSVMPERVSIAQAIETKRAFYAGAYAVLNILLHGPDDVDESVKLLNDLYVECDDFRKSVQKREA